MKFIRRRTVISKKTARNLSSYQICHREYFFFFSSFFTNDWVRWMPVSVEENKWIYLPTAKILLKKAANQMRDCTYNFKHRELLQLHCFFFFGVPSICSILHRSRDFGDATFLKKQKYIFLSSLLDCSYTYPVKLWFNTSKRLFKFNLQQVSHGHDFSSKAWYGQRALIVFTIRLWQNWNQVVCILCTIFSLNGEKTDAQNLIF